MVPDGVAITSGALVGAAVGAGTAVGAADAPVSPLDGIGVAVADEPHANIAVSRSASGPRIINLGFLSQ